MNKTSGDAKSLGVIALLAILAASMLSCFCPGLRFGGAPVPPPFAIDELLIDQSLFPEGWGQQGQPVSRGLVRLGVERIGATFISYGGVAVHDIYRSASVREAMSEYPGQADLWFSPREGWGAWSAPAELPYESPVADQFRFSCYTHQRSGGQVCQAVGRYGEYIVRFHTALSDDCMSFADMERILVAINERMASYLGRGRE